MDSNIFVYGIGVIMSLMVLSLAGMAWRKRQVAPMAPAQSPAERATRRVTHRIVQSQPARKF